MTFPHRNRTPDTSVIVQRIITSQFIYLYVLQCILSSSRGFVILLYMLCTYMKTSVPNCFSYFIYLLSYYMGSKLMCILLSPFRVRTLHSAIVAQHPAAKLSITDKSLFNEVSSHILRRAFHPSYLSIYLST